MYTQHDVILHKLSERDREIVDLKSLVTQLDLTRERLQTRLLNEQLENKKKTKLLQREMFERDELSKKYHSEILRNEKVARLNEELDGEKSSLQVALNEKDFRIRELVDRRRVVEDSNRQFEEAIVSLRKSFEDQLRGRQESILVLERDCDSAAQEMTRMKQEAERQTSRVRSLKKETTRLQSLSEDLARKRTMDAERFQRVSEESDRMKVENEDYFSKMTSMKHELTELRSQYVETCRDRDSQESLVREASVKVRELKKQLETTKDRSDLVASELETTTGKYRALKASMTGRVSSLESELDSTSIKLRDKVSEIRAVRGDNQSLFDMNRSLRDQVAELKNRADEFESKYQESLEESRTNAQELSLIRSQLQQRNRTHQAIQSQLEDEKLRRIDVEKQCSDLKIRDACNTTQNDEFVQQLATLQNRLEVLMQEKRRHDDSVASLKERNQTLLSRLHKHESMLLENERLKQEVSEIRRAEESLREEVQRHASHSSTLQQRIRTAEVQRSEELDRTSYLEEEVKKLAETLQNKEHQLAQTTAEVHRLKERDSTLKIQLRNVREEMHNIRERTSEVKGDNSRLRELVQRLDGDRERLMTSEFQIRREYNHLMKRVSQSGLETTSDSLAADDVS